MSKTTGIWGVIQQRRYTKDKDSLKGILRFYVGMRYEGQLYGVKITAKAYKTEGNRLYSIEVHDIEILPKTAEKNLSAENGEGEKGRSGDSGGAPVSSLVQIDKGRPLHSQNENLWENSIKFSFFSKIFKVVGDITGEKYDDNPKT